MDAAALPKLYGVLAPYDSYFQQLLAQIIALEQTWPVELVNKYLVRAEKALPVSARVFNPGPDPRTEKWPLGTPGLPVLIVLVYISLVLLLKPVVKALFPKLKLRAAVLLHNIFAAGMSAYMVYESWTSFDEIYGAESLLTSKRWSHALDGIDSDRSAWTSVAAHRLASILFVHYIMKVYELADTFIMIFKQNWRQVSFLHVYHHASGKSMNECACYSDRRVGGIIFCKPAAGGAQLAPSAPRDATYHEPRKSILLVESSADGVTHTTCFVCAVIFPTWYFNLLYYPGAEAWFCCFLNSLVHVIMYSYYGFQTMGIKMPFKPLVTVMQIVQFCLYLWQSGYMVFAAPAAEAKPLIAAWQLLIQASIFLYLFSSFFYATYINPPPKKVAGSSEKQKTQ